MSILTQIGSTNPLYLIVGAIIGAIGFLLILFYLISPMSFWNLIRIEYYLMYLTDNGNVVKKVIQKKWGQYFISYNKKAYLIPLNNLVRDKSGSIFYSDLHNAMPIKIMTKEDEEMIKEITSIKLSSKNKSYAREIISKVPIVNKFFIMKHDIINEVVFAKKFILNPPFIIDSCLLYIMLTQEITKKILEKPTTFMDKIVEYLPFIIVGVVVLILGMMYLQGK